MARLTGLTDGLIQRFLAATHDKEKEKKERIYYGTISSGGVILDGSDRVTPIVKTDSELSNGDRVSVMIKDHTAVVTGNFTKPATNEEAVNDKITELSSEIEDELSGYSSRISQNASNVNIAIRKAENAQDSADNAASAASDAQDTADSAATSAWNATQALGYKLDKGDVVTELNVSSDGVKIVGNRFEVYADNCAIDANGNAAFYQAQFPGGIKLGDSSHTNNAVTYIDNQGNTVTTYMCGGASGIIEMRAEGSKIRIYRGSIGPAYLATEDQVDSLESYVDNYCATKSDLNGYARTSDVPSDVSYNDGETSYSFVYAGESFSFGYGTMYVNRKKVQPATSSDKRLKKNIWDMPVDMVKKFYAKLRPVAYDFKIGSKGKHFGVLAQDIAKNMKDTFDIDVNGQNIIYERPADSKEKKVTGSDVVYGMNYHELHAFHITMIQELMRKNEELEARIKKLEEKE